VRHSSHLDQIYPNGIETLSAAWNIGQFLNVIEGQGPASEGFALGALLGQM
jgi:hypothetical protein